jgi:excisionase family DNA binding protein
MPEEPTLTHPLDEILTLTEVAAYLKIAERTVYLYAQNGKLPSIKIGPAGKEEES